MNIDWDNRVITLHQSDINSFLICPEQLRVTAFHGGRVETDAATVGTGVHATIEAEKIHGLFHSLNDMQDWGVAWFVNELATYEYESIPYSRSSFDTDNVAVKNLLTHLAHYWVSRERSEYLHPDSIAEWQFDIPFMEIKHDLEWWEIRLAGTADWVHPDRPMKDWKTASQEYKRWEKQRWAVQPTVYLRAAQHMGIPIKTAPSGDYEFEFKVFRLKTKNDEYPETVKVYRGHRHFQWLERQVEDMARYVLNNQSDEHWIRNDQHVLCSPKWCPNWGNCKGLFIDGEQW